MAGESITGKYKWFICTACNRVFKGMTPENIRAHSHVRPPFTAIRVLEYASFTHCFYKPELAWDWFKLIWNEKFARSQ